MLNNNDEILIANSTQQCIRWSAIIRNKLATWNVVLFSLGNFLCYIPLYMMTKMSADGLFSSLAGMKLTSFEIMPLYTLGNTVVIYTFLISARWFKLLDRHQLCGINLPKMRWYIVFSGLCTVAQIMTAVYAYAFHGVSIILAALLMKGGVLILAPMVDLIVKSRKRKIYWPSWVGAALSFVALIVASLEKSSATIHLICAIDITIYLSAYFIRLTIMSRWAKTSDALVRKQYITEEQIIISAGLIIVLAVMALIGFYQQNNSVFAQVWQGITLLPALGFILEPIMIGAAAAGVGIFGSLVFLDRRENTFCVAAIQSSSIVAGTLVTVLLTKYYQYPPLTISKITSVAIVLVAIIFLIYRSTMHLPQTDAIATTPHTTIKK